MALLAMVGILMALMLPAIQQAREAARSSVCKNNLKMIGLALHNYHDVYGTFPPAYVADADGKPMHSWRVLILPFLEQKALYDAYDFSQPWDAPVNQLVLGSMPQVYACPSNPEVGSNVTAYAAVFGRDCMFSGKESVKIQDVTDGTMNTLMVGEATKAGIPWTKPEDINVDEHPALGDPNGFSSHHGKGVHFLAADGRVVSSAELSGELDTMYRKSDGKAVDGF